MNEPAAPCIISSTLQLLALILIGGSANRSAGTNNSSIIVSKFPPRDWWHVPSTPPFSCSSSRPLLRSSPHVPHERKEKEGIRGTNLKPTIRFPFFLPSDV
ncbi:uncharacterized protein PgNI_04584 [Pyricularia grisea]|uniref:Secreted protein n=1 Tax=Pyricularia grisea TaxID=148305 RepID=A0A6P8B925_PYRGI|nr:uncharacterized protein PgNI_04584 [Pyricularia grisea]TLD12147.1 hypothetical protein PgNI_04584 [Pyricularia grisea]